MKEEKLNMEVDMKKSEKEAFGEEFFRERKEVLYRTPPEKLDRAILEYSRRNLAEKRFAFPLKGILRAAAAVLVLVFSITAYLFLESENEPSAMPVRRVTDVKKSGQKSVTFSRMDVAGIELYELNRELELVQNLLVFSSSREREFRQKKL